jgi:hypothetical protein
MDTLTLNYLAAILAGVIILAVGLYYGGIIKHR